MKSSHIALTVGWSLVLGIAALSSSVARAEESKSVAKETSAAAVPHRVVACYFHRTNRCPTCRKISSYIEESLKTRFEKEMKDGTVTLQMIDFQDPKNEQYTSYYKIENPTLVIMDVRGDKVSDWKPAPKVWSLVGKKEAFLKYVQDEVRGYLETK
jgi:hypothetical protein